MELYIRNSMGNSSLNEFNWTCTFHSRKYPQKQPGDDLHQKTQMKNPQVIQCD